MLWIIIDVALAVLSLLLLAVLGLGLWRRVKALSRELGRAGELGAEAGATMGQIQTR